MLLPWAETGSSQSSAATRHRFAPRASLRSIFTALLPPNLYGSASTDRLRENSDIDLFADVDYDRFGFVSYMRLRELFSQLLEKPVDFTTRSALHPDLKSSIEMSAVKVFDESFGTVAAE